MRVGAVGLVLSLSSGCAAAQVSAPPAAAVYTPLVRGWEQFFRITWEPFQRRGRPYVGGYVLNDWGLFATRVQLLVDGLDAKGKVVTQKVTWLGDDIPASNSTYFEVPVEAASNYRVRVFAYDWLETDWPRR